MNRITITTITTFLLLLIVACQKADLPQATTDEVLINILSPKAGETYKIGDTVQIVADISYTDQLHGYIIRINDKDGLIFETEGHRHSDNISISEQWVNTLSYPTELTMEVICVMDHEEKLKNANVAFNSQP